MASVQLLTGCLERADTYFPLYFLGFLVNLSCPHSTVSACDLNSCVFPFSKLHERKKWEGGTYSWSRTESCLVAASRVFGSRETCFIWHMGAPIFIASRNTHAAATSVHTNPAPGVESFAWQGVAWMLQVPFARSQMCLFLQGIALFLSPPRYLQSPWRYASIHLWEAKPSEIAN